MEALRQAKVGELLLSTVSTLASVAYGKLESSDLAEAKAAIDAIGALLPLLAGPSRTRSCATSSRRSRTCGSLTPTPSPPPQ